MSNGLSDETSDMTGVLQGLFFSYHTPKVLTSLPDDPLAQPQRTFHLITGWRLSRSRPEQA